MDTYRVKLEFIEPVLGAVPKSPEIYRDYIASKAALTDEVLAEEIESVEFAEESGWTGFHVSEDGDIFEFDYVLKGFFKDACGMLRRASGTKSSKLTAYKKVIDGLLFVTPRQIVYDLHGQQRGTIERPLRASTAQGERIALARSDTCPPGTTMEFQVTVLGVVKRPLLEEWLAYGRLRGLRQWRNAGYGAFEYELEKLS